jgi:hypothetical protein
MKPNFLLEEIQIYDIHNVKHTTGWIEFLQRKEVK